MLATLMGMSSSFALMTASMHLTEFSHVAVASTSMPWGQHNLGVSTNHLISFNSMSVCMLKSTFTHVKCALYASQHFYLQPVVHSLL
jgi:enterochelin esterase-like enzyme